VSVMATEGQTQAQIKAELADLLHRLERCTVPAAREGIKARMDLLLEALHDALVP